MRSSPPDYHLTWELQTALPSLWSDRLWSKGGDIILASEPVYQGTLLGERRFRVGQQDADIAWKHSSQDAMVVGGMCTGISAIPRSSGIMPPRYHLASRLQACITWPMSPVKVLWQVEIYTCITCPGQEHLSTISSSHIAEENYQCIGQCLSHISCSWSVSGKELFRCT